MLNNQNFNLDDLTYVPTQCRKCGKEGYAPTMKPFLENKSNPIVKMLEEDGFVYVECNTKHCEEKKRLVEKVLYNQQTERQKAKKKILEDAKKDNPFSKE